MKNREVIGEIVSRSFNGGNVDYLVESYGTPKEFYTDLIAYAEEKYSSGHSMRFTIIRDVIKSIHGIE